MLRNVRCLYCAIRGYADVAVAKRIATTSSETPKTRKRAAAKPKATSAWKEAVIGQLDKEKTKNDLHLRKHLSARNAQAQLIRYALNDDVESIVSFAHERVRAVNNERSVDADNDMFLAVSFLLVQRQFEQLLQISPNRVELTSIYFNFSQLWQRVRFLGPEMCTSTCLLLDSFERWHETRQADDDSDEIRKVNANIRSRLTFFLNTKKVDLLRGSQLLLNKDDRYVVELLSSELTSDMSSRLSQEDYGYDKDLALVDGFRTPIPSNEYLENPFSITGATPEQYAKLFEDQMAHERSPYLHVENVCRLHSDSSEGVFAEELIASWNWKEKIERELVAQSEDIMQYPLKSYLTVVPTAEIAELAHETLVAACSQGQNLVPIALFNYSLVAPILRRVHDRFAKKLGVNEMQLWSPIFGDYVQMALNAEVSRTQTHREWWNKCCRKHGVNPQYRVPFTNFDYVARNQLANFLVQVLTKACTFPRPTKEGPQWKPAFRLKEVSITEESRIVEDGRISLAKMVAIDTRLLDQLHQKQFRRISFPTSELPMLVPPRPWIDGGEGGPEYTRANDILRNVQEFRSVDINREMKARLKDRSQARPVLDALNQLGATPWRINKPMLDILRKVFAMATDAKNEAFLEKLSVPMHCDTVVIPTYEDEFATKPDVTKKEQFEFYKKRELAAKKRNEYNSLWFWMMYRVVMADHFKDRVLYSPHNMDFRGRVYPVSPFLSHMGDDVNRCMLKFANGRKLGANGLAWLKLHCINLTGSMKRQSVADRLVEADKLLPLILDSANDPLNGKRWWVESEEPWQTLAACIEIRDALAFDGPVEEFVSHVAVHQDGSCNGLQHYAALGRDRQGGEEVNLVNSEVPNDVYSSVAVRVEQKRVEDETGGEDQAVAVRLRVALPQAVPRKVIKQTVMTTVYGVTMYGAVMQIKRQLKALDIDGDEVANFSSYLARKTFASLHDAFTSSMQLKDWFRQCAKSCTDLMRTVEWVTPLGLPVVQPYLRPKDRQGRLILAPVPMKQIDAFPPNYVHSLDSTHMMLTSLDCTRRGLTFAAVHDCFWTHASSVDVMNRVCRQQFVQLHTQPLVERCSEWFLTKYLPMELRQKMGEEEAKRFEKVFTSHAKPGELDIQRVKDSVYFFS